MQIHVVFLKKKSTNFSPFFFQVQGKDPSVDFTQDIVEESEDERCFDEISDSVPAIDLPSCDIGKLEEISELVSSCLPSPIRREKLAVAIENEGYIKKLLSLFHMCEDLENTEGLHHLYEIFKNIFLLNKNALFELVSRKSYYVHIILSNSFWLPFSPRCSPRILFLMWSAVLNSTQIWPPPKGIVSTWRRLPRSMKWSRSTILTCCPKFTKRIGFNTYRK